MLEFVPQAHADPYTLTGTQSVKESTKDVADSGPGAVGSGIGAVVPLIIFGIFVAIVMKKLDII